MPSPEIERLMVAVYNQYQKLDDGSENAAARADFVFHMTDWEEDLERLATLFKNPEKVDKNTAGDIVFGFLTHALPHLMAAGRLLLGKLPDTFAATSKP
jgi:hypothetical protein